MTRTKRHGETEHYRIHWSVQAMQLAPKKQQLVEAFSGLEQLRRNPASGAESLREPNGTPKTAALA